MTSRFLITTPIESTWKTDGPVLFAGPWCMEDSREAVWSRLNHETVPYHWDDLDRMEEDQTYCLQVYEELLQDLSDALNAHHQLNWPMRSWRIVIGPWLRRYITILYDRYLCIHDALANYDVSGVACVSASAGSLVPSDYSDLTYLYTTDEWNYRLFSEIIRRTTTISTEDRKIEDEPSAFPDPARVTPTAHQPRSFSQIKANARHLIRRAPKTAYRSKPFTAMLSKLSRNNKFYVYMPYLPTMTDQLKLSMRLGDFPLINTPRTRSRPAEYSHEQRAVFGISASTPDPFRRLARDLIPEILPTCHLEGFAELRAQSSSHQFPSNPKAIFTTAAGLYPNELFKVWVAEKVTQDVRLVVGQHGGHYATRRIETESPPHELSVSDCYLSWGWTQSSNKVRPIPCSILINRRDGEWAEDGRIVIVTRPLNKYCQVMSTSSLPGKASDIYLTWLEDLLKGLTQGTVRDIVLALHPGERGATEKGVAIRGNIKARFPRVTIRDPATPLEQLYSESRLNIFTYDGTPFMESIGLDRPCILVSNQDTEPFSEFALPIHVSLEDAGLYHRSVESAVNHVQANFESIGAWWSSQPVLVAKQLYRDTFVKRSDHGLNELADELKNVIA